MTSSASLLWHPSLSSQLSQDSILLPLVPAGVPAAPCKVLILRRILDTWGELLIPTELHPNGPIQTLDEQCSPQQPETTVQRAGTQRGRSISRTEGCLCSLAPPHLPACPVHKGLGGSTALISHSPR